MRRTQVTVTILAAALVVAVTTVSLGVLGLANYLSDRNWEWKHLRSEGVSKANELAAALALPMWNFDRPQIERVIESQMHDPDVRAVVVRQSDVSAPGGVVTYARMRDDDGQVRTVREPPAAEGLLVEERRIATPGGEVLGTAHVYMTPRVIEAELRVSLHHLVWAILLLDALLSAGMYFLLWRAVLRPLKEIERYATSVWAEARAPTYDARPVPAMDGGYACRELQSLRGAIENMVRLLRARFRALQKNETMLSTVLNSVPHCIFWKDARGTYLGCNETLVKVAGLRNADEIVGKTDFDLPWPREDAEAYLADDREVMATNLPKRHIIEQVQGADGLCRWSDTTKVPLPDAEGKPSGVLGVSEDITERREAEEKLREATRFTEQVIANVQDGLMVLDRDLRYRVWNPRMEEISGLRADEVIGKQDLEVFPSLVELGIHDLMKCALAGETGSLQDFQYRVDGTGRRGWFWQTVGPLRSSTGEIVGVISTVRDTTERKEAEEALRREKAFNDAIFDSMPGILYLYDDEGRLIRWNGKAREITGYSDEELSRRHAGDAQPDEEKGRIAEGMRRALRDGHAVVEATLVTKDGTRIPYYFTGVRMMIDGKPHLVGVGIDITERKRAEEALRREKALTDAVFDNAPGLLCLFDDRHRPLRWNAKATEITGYSPDELAVQVLKAQLPEVDRANIEGTLDKALRDGRAELEMDLITKGAKRIPFYYTAARLMLDGRPHVLVLGMDATERKRAEDELRRALGQAEAANRAKDQFLAAASHELRTPLTPILLLASSMENDSTIPAPARRDLGVIREHIQVEKRLIGDLLDFTAIHAGKLHMHAVDTDVHDVVEAAIRTCREDMARKGQRLVVHLDALHHYVHGDPDRLRQVFWNLVQNACKFTPQGGAITLRTQNDDDEGTVRIEVSDTGMGMRPETLQKLFRPFEQGPRNERMQHYGGLGLGLAISKTLVEAHGGSISATSAGPDRGATFIVRLPVLATTPPPAPTVGHTPTTAQGRLRLLLVEDHELTLKTLRRLLVAEGHQVETAKTVAEALAVAANGRFDLVLSDIGLPDGSGCELMPILKDRYGLRGIALSGFGADGDLEASRNAGFLAHLTKPVTIEALREALVRFVADRQTSPAVSE